jgi:hypothetical protein
MLVCLSSTVDNNLYRETLVVALNNRTKDTVLLLIILLLLTLIVCLLHWPLKRATFSEKKQVG